MCSIYCQGCLFMKPVTKTCTKIKFPQSKTTKKGAIFSVSLSLDTQWPVLCEVFKWELLNWLIHMTENKWDNVTCLIYSCSAKPQLSAIKIVYIVEYLLKIALYIFAGIHNFGLKTQSRSFCSMHSFSIFHPKLDIIKILQLMHFLKVFQPKTILCSESVKVFCP